MTTHPALPRILIVCLAVFICGGHVSQAAPARRLYVEPFATKTGAERFREDVTAELRKLGSVSLVDRESEADLVLGGGGEIWVKGYRSLNPRSGRLPSDGTPVYGGYLSVELRDRRGATLWSWLATPKASPAATSDVSQELAKRIAKQVAAAIMKAAAPTPAAPAGSMKVQLTGAGATFPYPVYEKWFANYRRAYPETEIQYGAVGSQEGVRRLLAGEVDFGASDSPQAVRDLAPEDELKYRFFPAVVGAVVPIVNLPGFTGEIAFTPEALAGIYLGTIRKWNDPAIARANRGVRLPDIDITVVHRSDGSGTSYAWTEFLSLTNPMWKERVGAKLAPEWPVGRAAEGNDGVAKLVKELGGSIGYVEFIYALRNQLSYGKVRNRNGEFVGASLESIGIAAEKAMEMSDDLKVSLVDAPGAGAYPIASFTWFVLPQHIADDAKRAAIKELLGWMLGPGQTQAAALGYVALPQEVVKRERVAVGGMR